MNKIPDRSPDFLHKGFPLWIIPKEDRTDYVMVVNDGRGNEHVCSVYLPKDSKDTDLEILYDGLHDCVSRSLKKHD